ncbi:hypothetical protein G7Y89_g10671 [Cudoniella acicularis]|uniref:DUF726-domain-containing protein n=1 Tax=Cudoniella acicularis TaxID=354080 RepID=A0A8H4RCB4_9HELO|nr:hypothetical protein G7Y89_g10671 [Cudoniella acicularis]
MPPSASDPKDLKLILNGARRRAFTLLIGSIVTHMRKQIEYSFEPSAASDVTPLFVSENSRDGSSSDQEGNARQQRLEERLERPPSTPKLQQLKRDSLKYFDKWANEVRIELRKITDGPDDANSEQRRREWLESRNPPPPAYTPTPPDHFKTFEQEAAALAAEQREVEETKDVSMLQTLYLPIPTRFTTIPKEDRICVVSCLLLLLLSLGHYSAHSRTLLCYLTSSFALPLGVLINEETEVARTLMLASKALSADAETQKRQEENKSSRMWKVGLASVAGAALIGITGGLAAPVVAGAIGGIMGGVGLGGVASFLGIFAMNGALVGTLFGAYGAKMTGGMVDQYAKEVSDFKFLPVAEEWGEHTTKPETEEESRRLRVTIGINGWLNTGDDVIKPWRILGKDSEVFALRYEMKALLELGNSLKSMVSSYAWSYVKIEILKRTVLATLMTALWPITLLKMATSIDNPFAVARNRSEKSGAVLADALINKAQGERPVTLIGYSLGARVIYSCLKSLAERRAFGLVESVVFIGAPVPSNADNWRAMRAVVSGKVFNVYSENDYILAFLYRATSIQLGVAGLRAISNVEGINNLDLSKEVSGHLRYPDLVGKILKKVGIESVLIDNDDIENDIAEIKMEDTEDLIDFGLGDDEQKHSSTEMGGFRVVDDNARESVPFYNEEERRPETSGRANTTIPVLTETGSRSAVTRKPLATANSDPLRGSDTTGVPVLTETFQRSSITRKPLATANSDPVHDSNTSTSLTIPQHTTNTTNPTSTFNSKPPPPNPTDYSSEEEGGIQMQDNDSSPSDLQEILCEPIPDDMFELPASEGSDNREMGKAMFEEQKSLGGFLRGERGGGR